MRTDLGALLAAVLADPADDNVRLIYADALDDAGQHRRAEFIRLQIRFAEMGRTVEANEVYFQMMRARPGDYRARAEWVGLPAPSPIDMAVESLADSMMEMGAIFRRGFVEEVVCEAAEWVAHGDAVRARHPVERVTLTTMPVAENVTWNAGPPFYQDIQLGGQWVRINEREYAGADAGEFETGVRRRVRELALSRRWPGVAFALPEPEQFDSQNELLRAFRRQLNRELAELAPHIQAANPIEANGTARPRIEQRDVEAFVDEQIAIGRIAPALREQFIRDGLRASRQTRYATTPTPPAGPPPAVS